MVRVVPAAPEPAVGEIERAPARTGLAVGLFAFEGRVGVVGVGTEEEDWDWRGRLGVDELADADRWVGYDGGGFWRGAGDCRDRVRTGEL